MIAIEVQSALRDYTGKRSTQKYITPHDYITSDMMEYNARSVHFPPGAEQRIKYLEDYLIYVIDIPKEHVKEIGKAIGKSIPASSKIVLRLSCDKMKTMTFNALGGLTGLLGALLGGDNNQTLGDIKSQMEQGNSVAELRKHGIAAKEHMFRKSMAGLWEYARTGVDGTGILHSDDAIEPEIREVLRPHNVLACRRVIDFTDFGPDDEASLDFRFIYHWESDQPNNPIAELRKGEEIRLIPTQPLMMSFMDKDRRADWFKDLVADFPSLGRGWIRESDLQMGALDSYMQLPDHLKESIGTIGERE